MDAPMRPWGRKLLSVAEEVTQIDDVAVTTVVGVAAALVAVVLLLLCVCGNSGKSKPDSEKKQAEEGKTESANINSVTVTDETEKRSRSQNGKNSNSNRNSAGQSRSSQVSTASSQMRPTSLRELPEPPVQNGHPTSVSETINDEDPQRDDDVANDDDYDHLGGGKKNKKKKQAQRPDNYDHVKVEDVVSPLGGDVDDDQSSENYYTQVRERTYEVVKDATSSSSKKKTTLVCRNSSMDHYSSVSEVKDAGDIDPYDTVGEKDLFCEPNSSNNSSSMTAAAAAASPFKKATDNGNSKDSDLDPFGKVRDSDPYEKVRDSDPYTRVKDSGFDPYERIGEEEEGSEQPVGGDACDLDPYSTVDDDDDNDDPAGGQPKGGRAKQGLADGGGNVSSPSFELMPTGSMSLEFPEISDEYAVVMKTKQSLAAAATAVTRGPGSPDPPGDASSVLPPEPPRGYHIDEIRPQSSSTLAAAAARSSSSGSGTAEFDREYTMVTARESLASMTARNALNPYEIVPDNDATENMYATVDGSSGDGVIRTNSSAADESPLSRSLKLNGSSGDTYTEIGGPYNDVDVPAPPSVDSLHLMRRQQNDVRCRHLASPEDSGITRSSSDYAVVNKRSSFSPSATKLPEIPNSPSPTSAAAAKKKESDSTMTTSSSSASTSTSIIKVTLDPNYQQVKDCIADNDSEYDPNYESVEEAKASLLVSQQQQQQLQQQQQQKLPSSRPKRLHHYEEVDPIDHSPGHSEAMAIKDRVLNSHTYEDPAVCGRGEGLRKKHTYEDITEVKDQKKLLAGSGTREKYLYRRKKSSGGDVEEVTML